ncbi:hypothetical protein NL676_025849 [Syzygium grande]|nr:hypothetical protein NL676_025849 [Syzygium grande]
MLGLDFEAIARHESGETGEEAIELNLLRRPRSAHFRSAIACAHELPPFLGAGYGAGEKKLAKVIVPDKWKDGASNTTKGGSRKINENKLLSKNTKGQVHKVVEIAGLEIYYNSSNGALISPYSSTTECVSVTFEKGEVISEHYKLLPVDLRDIPKLDDIISLANIDPSSRTRRELSVSVFESGDTASTGKRNSESNPFALALSLECRHDDVLVIGSKPVLLRSKKILVIAVR